MAKKPFSLAVAETVPSFMVYVARDFKVKVIQVNTLCPDNLSEEQTSLMIGDSPVKLGFQYSIQILADEFDRSQLLRVLGFFSNHSDAHAFRAEFTQKMIKNLSE